MSKSIEERFIEAHDSPEKQRKVLREIFDAYTDPRHNFWGLLEVLGSIQKEFGADWKEHVIACMYGMELHDMGDFPDEWLEEIDDDEIQVISITPLKPS